MNTSSQFMDKQIMDLSSSSPPSTDFIDLMNNGNSQDDDHQKHRIGDNGLESKKEEIVPSYDFQPIHPYTAAGLSHSALDLAGSTTCTTGRVWSASDFKPISTSTNKGFGSLDDSIEPPANLVSEKGQDVYNTMIMSEIDRTMKKHVDTLLHVMEGVSARLTQLESRTRNLENLVDDLNVSVEDNHGSTDGKMRKLENILVEVQSGVQVLKDKQETIEAQLSTLQVSKVDQHPKTHSVHVDPTAQSLAPVPTQQIPQFPHTSFPQPPSSSQQIHQLPSSYQSLQQLPSQFSPQQEPYCPPPSHSQPPPPNQLPYQAPPQTHPPPHQPQPQQPQYPQQQPLSLGYKPEEQQQYPMQSYSPNPPLQQQPAGSSPSQQFYNSHPQPSMYDGSGGRSNPSFLPGYSSEPYPYTGSPSSVKPSHMSSSGTGYPQLSNSRPLPHTSAVSSGGSSSPRSESRVPIDDVIERVTTMGFPKDQVRATVRKLTENGQAVDLNVVLDKLMNDGGAPPGGWLGSR